MTSILDITIPAQRQANPSVPSFRGCWYDLVLEKSSDQTQRPIVAPLADIPGLYSDITYAAGSAGTKIRYPEFAKIALNGLPGNCTVSVFANGLSKPIGEKRIGRYTACVVFLRELTRVLPAGTTVKLHIAPNF